MTSQQNKIDTSLWVDKYSDELYRYAYYRVNDRELAYDFVQETFYSALKAVDKFEHKSTVKTWLYSILKRKIIDHWRQKAARNTSPMSAFSREEDKDGTWVENTVIESQPEAEKNIETKELNKALMGCINQLPPKWKGIFIDKYIDNKDSEEICNEHNISSSNFWVIIHRAKGQLKNCLGTSWL